ncbi:MAG TPA: 6,7-dimethyl-8-ribityllumazine synthase [Polyangia bacterium]|nr:6,7-dimethyl-8-ribityllumazine synthase [Polyangia bacterium]
MFRPTDSDYDQIAAAQIKARAAQDQRFVIVAARFNDFVVAKLIAGAQEALVAAGAVKEHIEVIRCPGALELPGIVRRVVDQDASRGVVVLGCVIRGATPHFDLVVAESTRGVAAIAAEGRAAIANGILACENIEQAIERCGAKGNRGAEAAVVAVEMLSVYRKLGASRTSSAKAKKPFKPKTSRKPTKPQKKKA